MISEIVGWLGVIIGIIVSVPQLVKSWREKSTDGLSIGTYQLLFLAVLCYLIRAIAIKEMIFIVSNAVNLVITAIVLYLFRKYPGKTSTGNIRKTL